MAIPAQSRKKAPLTPNMVVAMNIEAARKRKGWSQQWTCQQLAPLGLQWTRSNYAVAINTSAKGSRVRRFGADEVVAFARLFDCTISSLFLPPPGTRVVLPGGGPVLGAETMRRMCKRDR
jgi:hypothetical protein